VGEGKHSQSTKLGDSFRPDSAGCSLSPVPCSLLFLLFLLFLIPDP
jgi:hypothetical protein